MELSSENYYHQLLSLEKRRDRHVRYFLWRGISQTDDQDFILLWHVQTSLNGLKIASECYKIKSAEYDSNIYSKGPIIPLPLIIYNDFIKPYYHKNSKIND